MALQIITIPCLSDNYAYLIRDEETDQVAVVDAPEAAPILGALKDLEWSLDKILITHHHFDHIDGIEALQLETGAQVFGATADKHRLPQLDVELAEGDTFELGHETCEVLDVSGHTIGHIAFVFKNAKAAFTADSLMALGCGRLFEGDAKMMWDTMRKFKTLSDDTLVYSGHEYTASNAAFAITIEPDNADLQTRIEDITDKRANDIPTVPASIGLEKATNPFMRANLNEVKALVGMTGASDAEVFGEIRRRKDNF
ncbi:hydroxyacylglutathione hydrolase [Amylibacter sp. SFDW26]|uniref:hydroxyacylglutathione hydrolase n=1 Tax=Amylibacter sp. SFDW26 TaxID=2652722 RepID=UPI0012620CB8|nr:hydroxyacylglutathione hydrolase [Amylibacter sp. SFDW26]KAB7610459.1 hydroxyacylglutathione hydrolase [Amylibacter sp. SFDW26]